MQKVSEQKNLRAESEPPFKENHPENLPPSAHPFALIKIKKNTYFKILLFCTTTQYKCIWRNGWISTVSVNMG